MKVGDWYCYCCLHDLHQLTSEDEIREIRDDAEEVGEGQSWPTLDAALASLRKQMPPWDALDYEIAMRLEAQRTTDS